VDGQQGYLGEVDDELSKLGVAAGLRLEPARDGLRHRLQQQRAELRDREYHLFSSSTTAASPLGSRTNLSPPTLSSRLRSLEFRRPAAAAAAEGKKFYTSLL
jgi:hypothetical protein